MLSAIFGVDLDTFDLFALIAVIVAVVAAVLHAPARPATAKAYAHTVSWIAFACLAFAFLFTTP